MRHLHLNYLPAAGQVRQQQTFNSPYHIYLNSTFKNRSLRNQEHSSLPNYFSNFNRNHNSATTITTMCYLTLLQNQRNYLHHYSELNSSTTNQHCYLKSPNLGLSCCQLIFGYRLILASAHIQRRNLSTYLYRMLHLSYYFRCFYLDNCQVQRHFLSCCNLKLVHLCQPISYSHPNILNTNFDHKSNYQCQPNYLNRRSIHNKLHRFLSYMFLFHNRSHYMRRFGRNHHLSCCNLLNHLHRNLLNRGLNIRL